MDTKIINAENAPAAVGPYCHAVEAGDFVFTYHLPSDER